MAKFKFFSWLIVAIFPNKIAFQKKTPVYTHLHKSDKQQMPFKDIAGRDVVQCVSLLGGQMNLFVRGKKCWLADVSAEDDQAFAITMNHKIGNCYDNMERTDYFAQLSKYSDKVSVS